MQVLDITLYLSNKEGYILATKILVNILSGLSQIRPMEGKAMNKSYDLPTAEFLPVRVSWNSLVTGLVFNFLDMLVKIKNQ